MRLLRWRFAQAQARLKINNEYRDTNVKMNAIQVFCLAFVNFVSMVKQKAIKGCFILLLPFVFGFSYQR